MKKKLFSLLLMAIVGVTQFAAAQDLDPNGGTKDNPFRISTKEQLCSLIKYVKSGEMNYIVLEADIDMAGVTDWTPLFNNGGGYPYFDFDGQNHVISNLTSDLPGAYDYPGLFGVLCGSVRNLGIENADVTSTGGTGIIAGYLGHSSFSQPSYMENVWVTGKLHATGYCGGMIGNIGGESYITNCYANVAVTGEGDLTGGIIGRIRGKLDMKQVYAAGSINRGGGVIGGGQNSSTPPCSYSDIVVWNNTAKNFGPLAAEDALTDVVYYDGSNFAALQSVVLEWGKPWASVGENEYPTFGKETTPAAPDLVDGYYQIGTPEQLVWFSHLTNYENSSANAVLTADIDMTGINFTPIGMHYDEDSPEGIAGDYRGTFDGQGHIIKNLYVKRTDKCEAGFIGRTTDAVIKNLGFENATIEQETLFSNNTNVRAGIVAAIILRGQVTNCFTRGELVIKNGTGTNGYLVGTFLQNFGGNGQPMTSCYTSGAYLNGGESSGTVICSFAGEDVTAKASTGELCYLLNDGKTENVTWYQTLGNDAYPTLDATHKIVYANGPLNCVGAPKEGAPITYDNEYTSVLDEHNYVNGLCSVCGKSQADYMTPDADGYYNIADAYQLCWFATKVNEGEHTLKGRLTADIDMKDIAAFDPIGCGPTYNKTNPGGVDNVGFAGTFDGQGFNISNIKVVDAKSAAIGIFGVVTGTVKNLGVIGLSYTSTDDCRAGGIAGTVTASAQSAGLIDNCFVANSSIITDNRVCGGVVGAVCGGTVQNCYGFNNNVSGYGDRFGGITGDSKNDNGWVGTVLNCYTDHARVTSSQAGTTTSCQASVTASRFASGEIAFLLNNGQTNPAWFQNLGSENADAFPVLNATHGVVYSSAEYRCDGKLLVAGEYTNNSELAKEIPAHQYVDGICTVCTLTQPDYVNYDADGYCLLGDAKQLNWFAAAVNEGKSGLNARLIADIDMSSIDNFQTIARYSDNAAFSRITYGGVFDGQGHEISNLKVSVSDPLEAGLFGRMNGATVKNLGIVNAEIISTGTYNDKPVRAGVLSGEAVSSTLMNIYTKGTLNVQTGHEQRCGISGEAHQSTLINCWSTFEGELAKGNITALTNCYTYTDVAAKAATGELCYLLNGNQTKDAVWFQTLGTDEYPVLDPTHGKVYLLGEAYVNNYATTPDLVDGTYQIKNAADLNGFAQIVNGGQTDANAVLTDNIDMSGIELTAIGKSGYNGRFDGGGFAINNLESDGALFGVVKPGAVIRDLTINGTIVGDNNTAAFADEVTNTTEAPVADLLDVVFKEDGTAEDVSPMHNTVERVGEGISVYYNETLKRYVARFDNPYGGNCTGYYQTPSYEAEDNAVHNALADGHTLEVLCMADFDGAIPNSETKPFSAMQAGGTGFLVSTTSKGGGKNVFTFLPNVTTDGKSTWRWTTSDVQPETQVFYHVVGVWNKEEQKAYIYVNGELSNVVDAPGDLKFASSGCNWFAIGGDPANATSAHGSWKGDVALARAYDKALTEDEAKALWMKLQDETNTADMVQLIDCHNNATVKGGNHTGGLIGHAESAAEKPMSIQIVNSSNSGAINGGNQTGGLVGYSKLEELSFAQSTNDGTVNGGYHVGGFVGSTEKKGEDMMTFTACGNLADVIGATTSVGGFVGRPASPIKIMGSFNSAKVEGTGCIGGILGNLSSAGNATIESCYNTGAISSVGTSESKTGGLIGNAGGEFMITNSFNTATISGAAGGSNGVVGGLVGVAEQKFTIEDSYNAGAVNGAGNNCGGLVGWEKNSQKAVLIQNSWNVGDVTSTGGENAGGIIGGASGRPIVSIINCYNTGAVAGNKNSGGMAGWLGNSNDSQTAVLTISNCWSTGKLTNINGSHTMYRYGSHANNQVTLSNNYELSGTVENPTNAAPPAGYTAEWLENGHFAYYINNVAGKIIYRQNIGEDKNPELGYWKGIVYAIGAAGYGTLYNTETALTTPAGVTASTGVIKGNWISLTEVSGAIPAATPVVLQGAEGFYSFMPTDEAGTAGENDLKGTAEPLAATGIQYVLAEKDGVAGFYQAAEGTKIPAGKAYIEKAAAGVKGFFFGDATGIAEVETATEADATIYDLSGRRVEKAQKGVYIINGKKVMK